MKVKCRLCKKAEYELSQTEIEVSKMMGYPVAFVCKDCDAKRAEGVEK